MARHCQVTGKKTMVGNRVSHAHNVNKRRFYPNIHRKKYWVAGEKRFVVLNVSTHGMKIIDKVGIEKVIQKMKARGEKLHFTSPKKDETAVQASRAEYLDAAVESD